MAAKRKAKSRTPFSRVKTSDRRSSQSKLAKAQPRSEPAKAKLSCPIVGIGGSAGGFEAAMELLRHLPTRTGMAFVIVQHLDPHHGSRLPNLLGKATSMPVTEVTETITPQPNAIYVQPPNKCVIAKNGKLTLVSRTEKLNVAIDHFFESLAEECGSRGIGVVLSGTGSDGTAGPGKHDADSTRSAFFSERLKKVVDRDIEFLRAADQCELAIFGDYTLVGWLHINRVWFWRDRFCDLVHWHRCGFAQQISKPAAVMRIEMLHDHKRHARSR